MNAVVSAMSKMLDYLAGQFSSLGINDIIDIICVSVLIYFVIKFIKDRRAGKLAIGILVLVIIKILSDIFSLNSLGFLISNVFQAGLVAIIIVFQPELRSALETIGREPFKSIRNMREQKADNTTLTMIDELADACSVLSDEKTGAIIVIERTTRLGDIIKSGTVVDATPTQYLIRNLFYKGAPLHDGALIIRDGRLHAAGCFLPLTMNSDITKELGSRHRAGLGMSENSDAVVIIVSEETGNISLAVEGNLKGGYNRISLKKDLIKYLAPAPAENKLIKIKASSKGQNK